jgi:long-chain acyl-CoA synthetase
MAEDLIEVYGQVVQALTRPGGPFEVAETRLNGRRARVYLRVEPDLNAFFQGVEAANADRVFLAYEDRSWTYAEVFAEARRLAGSLASRYGVGRGSRVGLAMRNRMEWFCAFIAVQRLGAVAVLFNSRGAAAELEAAASQTACDLIIADESRAALFAATGVKTPLVLVSDDSRAPGASVADLAAPGLAEAPPTAVEADDPAAILFTSGTTGRAKGAVLTHRNLVNMAHNLRFSSAVGLELAAHRMGVDAQTLRSRAPAPSTLLVTPLFHISGVTNFITACFTGGRLVLVRRWDGAAVLPLISRHGVTAVSGPTMVLSDLLDQPDAERHLASITSFVVAGQATPLSLIDRVGKALPRAAQATGWGMTEASGSIASASGPVLHARPGSVGRFSPVMEGRVVAPGGEVLAPGEVGELQVRGALVMKGYWNQPEATAAAFDGDWYRTGDLGYMTEDGFVHLVDRAKDMVISAGENIYCAEVERVLCASPDFSEAALFGVPDARLGERAIAAVAPKAGVAVSEAQVKALVRAELADYKVPAEVVFDIAPLPRNAVGKVDKAALRLAYFERLRESA